MSGVTLFQRHEEREVIQPGRVPRRDPPHPAVCLESRKSAAQQGVLVADHRTEIDARRREIGQIVQISRRQQPVAHQPVGADQQRIARERRERLVRRVAIPRRPERQHLPQPLPRRAQKPQERPRLVPQFADAVAPRQRGRVQQNPAGALAFHRLSSIRPAIHRPTSGNHSKARAIRLSRL
jgi:hypothetical protein